MRSRLGANKKKKRVRRTEGRTGRGAGAHAKADGKAVFCNRNVRTVRHKTCCRSARREIRFANSIHQELSGGKITVFPWLRRFYAEYGGRRNSETPRWQRVFEAFRL
jgi:hypothetical protein